MADLTVILLDDPVDASLSVINGNFSALNLELAGKAGSAHLHAAADITSGVLPPARLGSGTPSGSMFLRGDGLWSPVSWSDVAGKPAVFTPDTHTHSASDIVGGVLPPARLGSGTPGGGVFLRGDSQWASVGWADVTGKPATFAPSTHTHPPSQIEQGGATTGQALVWSGSQWAPGTVTGANSATPYTAQGTSFTAVPNTRYRLTANSLTITLPASPADGDWVELVGGVSGCTVARNGRTIMGLAEDMLLNVQHVALRLVHSSANGDWRITA